jgi:2-keto-3-deoxy-6-phosphogluconate aldolase
MNRIMKHVRTFKTHLAAVSLLAFGVTAAQAHPGHSLGDESAMHFVTSPYHLLLLAVGGVALCGAAVLVKHAAARRLLAAGGAIALLVAATLRQMPN